MVSQDGNVCINQSAPIRHDVCAATTLRTKECLKMKPWSFANRGGLGQPMRPLGPGNRNSVSRYGIMVIKHNADIIGMLDLRNS